MASAQDVEDVSVIDGKVTFDKVFEAGGKSKQELFAAAKIWLVNYFKDEKDVIVYSDIEEGRIISKGIGICGSFPAQADVKIQMTITVLTKDEKYRVIISSISFQTLPTPYDVNRVHYSAEMLLLPENYYKKNGQPKAVNENYRECVSQILLSMQKMVEKPLVPANEDW